jgi:hypothetical protein
MAEIVVGVATSHTPRLSVPPQYWQLMGENDPRIVTAQKFDRLSREKAEWVGREITFEKFQTRHARVWQALGELQQILHNAAADVVVTVGDDQRESFTVAHNPAIDIYWGQAARVPRATCSTSSSLSWPRCTLARGSAPTWHMVCRSMYWRQDAQTRFRRSNHASAVPRSSEP